MLPTTPLRECAWIAAPRLRVLERNGIDTVEQLLTHFPRRYEDRQRFDHFPADETATAVCVCGLVKKTNLRRIRGGQKMFDVLLEEESAHVLSAPLLLRWFNAHWIEKMIAVGQRVVVYGKPKRSGTQIVIAHPEIEIADDDAEASIHLQRIVPIHPASEGLSPRVLRRIMWDTLQQLTDENFPTLVPASLNRWPRAEALRQIHFPDDEEKRKRARQHLVLEEFFALQLTVAAKRREHSAQRGAPHCGPGVLLARFHAALPFPLTGAQQRSIAEIRSDLASTRAMNRMLHGDVGSGKTLVALSAMLLCVEAGFQAALMAPTQILAEQHFLTLRRLCEPLGFRVSLRTGARKEDAAPLPLFADTARDETSAHLVVGTHALLYDGSGIANLGLAVIDEQHKFGVLQRARLIQQGQAPDVLVMTATPIPRTLTMTLYGDLDVSVLDELPANRGKIITALRGKAKLPDVVKFLREQLHAGRQAYVVYPLIEESERLEAKAAAAEFSRWQELVAPARCELLHGRVAAEEKDAIMDRFRRGETHVLIATSVIEVGIDVPNASLMLIESAERFGLAQLHQLRGRIGRGPHTSYCVLISDSKDEAALEKLRTLERTSDGFEIADADLRMRGPGDLLGTAQSGLPPLKLGDVFADADLMKLARNAAFLLFERDPQLEQREHHIFRALLKADRRAALGHIS